MVSRSVKYTRRIAQRSVNSIVPIRIAPEKMSVEIEARDLVHRLLQTLPRPEST